MKICERCKEEIKRGERFVFFPRWDDSEPIRYYHLGCSPHRDYNG